MIADTDKQAINWPMLPNLLTAPLCGGEEVVVDGVLDVEGGDGVVVAGGLPLGVVLAATTLIASFMPPTQ